MRRFKPVDPPPRPRRLSYSLLNQFDSCPRAAWLGLTHEGTGSHPMARGSAFHDTAERATMLGLLHGEMPDPDTCKAILREVLEEMMEPVPWAMQDRLRQMVYHWATAFPVGDTERIVGVEQLMVLDVAGWRVSGKLDLARIGDDATTLRIDDYKTSPHVPSMEQFELGFQTALYALLAAFGRPVARDKCDHCGGAGTHHEGEVCPHCVRGYRETVLDRAVGDGIERFVLAEVYPYHVSDKTGEVVQLVTERNRADLLLALDDLKLMVTRFDAALQGGDWPAVPGSHCSRCPAAALCPIPVELRNHAGAVNDIAQASEAAEWVDRMEAQLKAIREELKRFAAAHEVTIPFGADREFGFTKTESFKTDWIALEEGVQRARELGEPFDLAMVRKPSVSTRFGARTLKPNELEARDAA